MLLLKNISVILLLLTSSIFTLSGQEDLTLSKAISIAIENNYGIKIAEKNVEIAENNNTWARAGRTPIIDLNGTFNNSLSKDNNPASFIRGAFYNGSLGATVNASYVIYGGGRVKINKEQLGLGIERAMLNQQVEIHNLIKTVYDDYYAVIYAQEQLEVINRNFQLSKSRLEYEKVRKAYGTSNTFNLTQFENSVLSDSTSLLTQQQTIDNSKRNLYTTLQLKSNQEYVFNERLSLISEDIDYDKMLEILSEENYTIKSLEMLAEINKLNTALAQSNTRPQANLTGSVGFVENGLKIFADDPQTGLPFPIRLGNRLNGTVGASMAYNLYDGGIRKDNIQNAKIQEEIDQLSLLEVQTELRNQLDLLIDNYQYQVSLLDMADKTISLSKQNLDIIEERFKAGQVSSLDFIAVQNQYLMASFNKVNYIYQLLLTKGNIDFLVGKFTAIN